MSGSIPGMSKLILLVGLGVVVVAVVVVVVVVAVVVVAEVVVVTVVFGQLPQSTGHSRATTNLDTSKQSSIERPVSHQAPSLFASHDPAAMAAMPMVTVVVVVVAVVVVVMVAVVVVVVMVVLVLVIVVVVVGSRHFTAPPTRTHSHSCGAGTVAGIGITTVSASVGLMLAHVFSRAVLYTGTHKLQTAAHRTWRLALVSPRTVTTKPLMAALLALVAGAALAAMSMMRFSAALLKPCPGPNSAYSK